MPKREKYNLQRLIEVRERKQEDAAKMLAGRRDELASAEHELNVRKDAVEDCRRSQRRIQSEMLEKAKCGISTDRIVAHRQYLADLRTAETELLTAVEQQTNVVSRADAEVSKALLELNAANKEVRVVEKHRENWQRDRNVESVRREQKANDEIGAILHERQKLQ